MSLGAPHLLFMIVIVTLTLTMHTQGNPNSSPYRALDELAGEIQIESRQDAIKYVDSALGLFRIDAANIPELDRYKKMVAVAEYDARRSGSSAIEETNVAEAFDVLVDLIHGPATAKVSGKEVHYFRDALSLTFPHLVPRGPSGEVASSCRPVEAVFILYLLDRNRGVPDGIRALAVRNVLPSQASSNQGKLLNSQAGLSITGTTESAKAYMTARHEYLAATGPLGVPDLLGRVLQKLSLKEE